MDTQIKSLGEGRYDSPLRSGVEGRVPFKTDADRVLFDHLEGADKNISPMTFEVAGPRV